jgi:DNA invertase Pin-like site-specific DNA recombinase
VTTISAAVYVRISRDRIGAGLGVERQEKDCRELAARPDWTVVETYSDNDISAYSGKRRPAYDRMLADIEAGRVQAVIAWHTDRLHRSPVELERYIDVCQRRGVETHTVKSGELDLTTASGRMVARMLGAAARHESEQKSERLRRQRRQAQAEGRWNGGRRPFGYGADGVTVHPIEGPAITDATRRILAGDSLRGIARDWNDRGLLTATGTPWNASKLAQMLTRPRNAGLVGNRHIGRRDSRIVGDATWPAVVDRDSFTAIVGLLSDPSRRTHRGVSRRLVGSGIYFCGGCGERMRSGGQGAHGQDRYMCASAKACTRRVAEPIDDLVRAIIAGVLRRDGVKLLPPPAVELTPMRDRLGVLRARAEELAAMFGAGELTGAEFRAAKARNDSDFAGLEAEIGRLSAGSVLAGIADADDAGRTFLAADVDRQRAVIDALVEVTVMPIGQGRHGFDPHSVEIEWRAL